CSVVIVPYAKHSVPATIGMHAKLYQAMTARKPIVAYRLARELAQDDFVIAENEEDFVFLLERSLKTPVAHYTLDLSKHDWRFFKRRFWELIGDGRSTAISPGERR